MFQLIVVDFPYSADESSYLIVAIAVIALMQDCVKEAKGPKYRGWAQ